MRRKKFKTRIDEELLDTVFSVEFEWKQIQAIVENSIEPSDDSLDQLQLAQAKYIFLLKEARHRKVSAIRYY